MIKISHCALFALIMIGAFLFPFMARASEVTLQNVPVQVIFSPGEKQVEAVVREVENATLEVLVQSRSFDSARVATALREATKRAVSVEVMVDNTRQSDKSGVLRSLMSAKIPVLINGSHATALDEVIIIDKTTVITGAFRLSTAGGKTAGNMLIVRSKDFAGLYLDNWLGHRSHAYALQGIGPAKGAAKKKKK
ncbi:MAG TPA: phospholipase D-like domain-containing protein [Syntrophorhabdaceae bacterium]